MMKRPVWIILVILVWSVSCSKETDYSYTAEKYRELGMPDWSGAWTPGDLGDAISTLRSIKNNEPLALPRKGSRRSGELFDRIISMENLSFLYADSLPLHEKAYRIESYTHIQNELCGIYTNYLRKEQYYGRELVSLYIFGLSTAQEMLNLAHRINESDDPDDISMRPGSPSIQYLYIALLSSSLSQQRLFSVYPEKDLETLADSIIHSIQRNRFWFDQATADNIKDKMRAVVESSSSKKIRGEYLKFIDNL